MSAERVGVLARRLREFHGVELEQVLEVIDYLRDGDDTVLVGGSLAYGLGNRKSDLDIVVAAPPDGESSSRMPLEHFIDSLRVDVWKLRRNELEAIFARAREHLGHAAPLAGSFGDVLEQADLKLLHRVAYGVVIDGPDLADGEGDRAIIAGDLLTREYAERMRHAIFVAQLALEGGQPVAAAVNARFAVEDGLQATIAARGFPFSDNKWLQVRLQEDTPELQRVYAPFAILPEGEAASAGFVAAAVAALEELHGLELGREILAADAAWENPGLELRRAGDLRLLVYPDQDVLFELSEEEAEAWAELGEEPVRCSVCTTTQASICYFLYSEGMMTLTWARGVPVADLKMRREEALDEAR